MEERDIEAVKKFLMWMLEQTDYFICEYDFFKGFDPTDKENKDILEEYRNFVEKWSK